MINFWTKLKKPIFALAPMEDVTDTVFRQIIIHGRTVSEMSDSPAHWDEIGKAVKLRDSMKSKTLIIGNGDVKTREDAMEKYKKVLQNLHFRPASPKLPPRLGEAGQRGELAGCKKCADGAYEIQNRFRNPQFPQITLMSIKILQPQ